jgi:osmotically-inducible protein OsmY
MRKTSDGYAPRLHKAMLLSFVLALSAGAMALSGCSPLGVPISAIEAVAEDRSSSDIATDTKIKAGIISDINGAMTTKLAALLNVDVYEQEVMLTGVVKTAADKAKAGSLAIARPGVKNVLNEIQVVPEGKEPEGGVTDDIVIEKKFYGKLASSMGVSHTNWRYRAVNHVIYLFGRALSIAERDKVIAIAEDVDGVPRVVNHAFVRGK